MEQPDLSSAAPAGGEPKPIKWYARSALEQFLEAADSERARLESIIVDADVRFARSNAAVGMHQTMMELLLDAQREVYEIRHRAELEAAAIIDAGEAEARLVLAAAQPAPAASAPDWSRTDASSIPAATPVARAAESTNGEADDEFFRYLKGALHDELKGALQDEPEDRWEP